MSHRVIHTSSTSKIRCDLSLPGVFGPLQWGTLMMQVPDVKTRAALDKQPNDIEMARQSGLMQGRGMRMASHRIVPAGIPTGVEQQRDNLGMSMLGCQGESLMPLVILGDAKALARCFQAASRRGSDQVHTRAAANQRVNRVPLTVAKG